MSAENVMGNDTLVQKLEALKVPQARFRGDAWHIHNAALDEAINIISKHEGDDGHFKEGK